jgi:hypothetical protein
MYHLESCYGSNARLDAHTLPAHHEFNGVTAVPAKSASTRVSAKTSAKSVRASVPEPRRKKVRMSKLEANRLAHFKALMKKFGGKGSFAGFDD